MSIRLRSAPPATAPAPARSDRHDWMVLLPATVELPAADVIVVGGTEEVAGSLVTQGLAARWRRPCGPADQSRVTVAWADAACSLEELAAHVAPGGVLVAEIDRGRARHHLLTARRVEQRLERCGMQVHSVHLVEPSFASPGRYLPADAPGAVRWYLDTLFIAATPATRIAAAAMSSVAASPLGRRAIGATGPRLLVIATDPLTDRAPRLHDLEPPPMNVPAARAGDRAILLTSGYDIGSRAVALLFGPAQRRPRVVVKVASGPRIADGTLGEHTRLTALHRTLPAPLAAALPLPLLSSAAAGRVACVQTSARGRSMNAAVGRWGHRGRRDRARLAVVTDWLTDFALATRVGSAGGRCAWTDVFSDLAAEVALPRPVVGLLATAERVAVDSGLASSAVHQHYDTGPWNVHVDGDRPSLVDWESDHLRPADWLGPPLADTLYLATYWYFLTTGVRTPGGELPALLRLFAEPQALDTGVLAVRRAVDRSLVALGLGRRCVPAALVALWAERTLYTHRRRISHGTDVAGGEVRAAVFLQALAEAPGMFDDVGWWSFPVGTNVAAMAARRGR